MYSNSVQIGGGRFQMDAHLLQAAIQARRLLRKTERPPAIDRHHLVHAVAQEDAAAQHADLGVVDGGVRTVQITGQGRQLGHAPIIAAPIFCHGWQGDGQCPQAGSSR